MPETNQAMVERLAQTVAREGGRVYYVGGYVRDRLMGRENKDLDIEVHGVTPAQLEAILDTLGKRMQIGESFGVYALKGYDVDIAMPRCENATGRGHRDFAVSVDPFIGTRKAAMRRDFTINAMMQDVLTGEIYDYYGGREDLAAGVIRCVHPETFVEDALRVFRAAQFAARLGAEIEPETRALCRSMEVSALTMERVFAEMEKALLKAERPSVFFRELREMNQLRTFFPEVESMIGVEQNPRFHPEGDVFEHTMLTVDAAAELRERAEWPLCLMLAALLHDTGKVVATQVQEDGRITAYGHEVLGLEMVGRQLRRLTRHERLIGSVKNHVALHMRPNMLAEAGSRKKKTRHLFDLSDCPNDLILLSRADATGMLSAPYDEGNEVWLRERLEDYRKCLERPMVTGRDLIAAGLKPDERFGKLIARGRYLHFCGLEKQAALRQVLAEMNKMQEKMQ